MHTYAYMCRTACLSHVSAEMMARPRQARTSNRRTACTFSPVHVCICIRAPVRLRRGMHMHTSLCICACCCCCARMHTRLRLQGHPASGASSTSPLATQGRAHGSTSPLATQGHAHGSTSLSKTVLTVALFAGSQSMLDPAALAVPVRYAYACPCPTHMRDTCVLVPPWPSQAGAASHSGV